MAQNQDKTLNFKGLKEILKKIKYVDGAPAAENAPESTVAGIPEGESTNMDKKQPKPKNIILYGPPGTGKTYSTILEAVNIIEGCNYDDSKYDEVKEKYNQYLQEGRIQFLTFHQSYGYEDFIEGIKAKVVKSNDGSNTSNAGDDGNGNNKNNGGNVSYDIEDGIFKKFCDDARNKKDENGNALPYVFIIDEINRGNISKIFGELITLIEETKREGEKEAMSTTLPYSKEEFTVPSNVYIIGTMNTADRSIAVVDTALRRRFTFKEIMPNPELVKIDVDDGKGGTIKINELLTKMNDRITALYDREHTIGHSFFMGLNKNSSIDALADIMKNKIIPLLQEYFYEDYEKIRLVLGDNQKGNDEENQFIVENAKKSLDLFGNPDVLDEDAKLYIINKDAFIKPEAYRFLQYYSGSDAE